MVAPSVNNSVDKAEVSSSTSTTTGFAVGGSNRVLYVVAELSDGAPPAVSNVTWNGSESLTLLYDTGVVESFLRIVIYRLVNPTATTASVVVNLAATCGEWVVTTIAMQDTDQSTPDGGGVSAHGNTNADTALNVTSATGKLVIDFIARFVNDILNPGAGQTQIQGEYVSSLFTTRSSVKDGATTTALAWSSPAAGSVSAYQWVNAALSINEVAAGGPTPAITSASDSTPQPGDSIVLTGTDFGATQGTGGVTLGGESQTVTSWADTSITVTVAEGGLSYGSKNFVVTANGGAASSGYAVTLTPATGWSTVDVVTPLADPSQRLRATPDIASGDQIYFEIATVANDASFTVDPSVYSWRWKIWTTGFGWSGLVEQVMYQPSLAHYTLQRVVRAIRRRAAQASKLAFDALSYLGGPSLNIGKWFAPEMPAPSASAAALAATPTAQATMTAALTTGVLFTAAESAQATQTAALTTAIQLAATPTAQATLTADLTIVPGSLGITAVGQATQTADLATAIQLAQLAQAVATMSPSLTTAIQLVAAPVAQATMTADLSTQTQFASAPSAVATMTADLTTGIQLATVAQAQATQTASLLAGSGLTTNQQAAASMTAALTVGAGLESLGAGEATQTAALTTAIRLAMAQTAQATMTADLSTGTTLAAAQGAQATMTADLTITPGGLNASLGAQATMTASLTTAIQLAAVHSVQATQTPSLSTSILLGTLQASQASGTSDLAVQTRFAMLAQCVATMSATLTTQVRFSTFMGVISTISADLDNGLAPLEVMFGARATMLADLTVAVRFATKMRARPLMKGSLLNPTALVADAERTYRVPFEDRTFVEEEE